MKRVRAGGLAAVGVGLLLAVAACGGGSQAAEGGDQTITLWLNGTDTPQELRDYLVKTFEAQNEGATLKIEEQDWNGLVPRLQTALASEDQTPDLVEIGNTQSPTFTYAGAFTDITDMVPDLGGDDLLPGFVDAGTVDDKVYAVPYYSGARAGLDPQRPTSPDLASLGLGPDPRHCPRGRRDRRSGRHDGRH